MKGELTAEQISHDSQELKQKQCAVNLIPEQSHESLIDYKRFSSFYKLIRVIALVLKFIKKAKKIKVEIELSLLDLQEAENLVIKDVQKRDCQLRQICSVTKNSLQLFYGQL